MLTLFLFRWSPTTSKSLHYLSVAKIAVFLVLQGINSSCYLKISLRTVNIPIANIPKVLIFNEDVLEITAIWRK